MTPTLPPMIARLLAFLLLTSGTTHRTSAESNSYRLRSSLHDVYLLVNGTASFDILLSGHLNENVTVSLIQQHDDIVQLEPSVLEFLPSEAANVTVSIHGLHSGHLEITANSEPGDKETSQNVFVRVTVANSALVTHTSFIFGWLYFLAWSISFYPQIYTNFRRKSVVGLNFDFVILNLIGFIVYSVFNVGLFWIPSIKAEYMNRHPRGVNPVMLNDVVFSLHALFATIITIYQCLVYERSDQRISRVNFGFLSAFIVFALISAGVAFGHILHWLDFLYLCSYIKLTITIVKYVPQALMNYQRKSTVGWSIGNILLDFTGGILSMLQMLLNVYNYDDWGSIFGDRTKFGLGLFSVLFDLFFMLQHYVLYRNAVEATISNTTTCEDLTASDGNNTKEHLPGDKTDFIV